MSESVRVPYEGEARDKAVLLLAAAEELGHPASVVRTVRGGFEVPADVNDKAFGKATKKSAAAPAKKAPAKKAAAKKAPAKKAAKKSTSEKPQE